MEQEEEERGRISSAVIETTSTLIFSSLENIKKPWYVPSRRLVIQETVFRIPDLTPLPYVQEEYKQKYQDVYC